MHTCRVDLHEAGLQDGCPACEEHAANPLRDLDETMLRYLVRLAILGSDRFAVGRSDTELVAAAKVLTALELFGSLAEKAPAEVATYLADRWRLEAMIVNPRSTEVRAIRAGLETDPDRRTL